MHENLCGAALALAVLTAGPAVVMAQPAVPQPASAGQAGPASPDEAGLREFCTDRPTRSNLACILDQGHWQVESDLANAAFDHGVDTYLFTSPTIKYGLTPDIDVEAQWTPYEAVHTPGAPGQPSHTAYGVGDLTLRAKIGLTGQDAGGVAATLLPYLKAPTAPATIGNGAWEGGLIAPVTVALNDKLNLTFDPEVDILKNRDGDGRHPAMAQLVNLSYDLPKNVTVYGELWADVNFDPTGVVDQYSADFAVSWLLLRDLQLDVGTNLGLNRETARFQVYTGVSRRF